MAKTKEDPAEKRLKKISEKLRKLRIAKGYKSYEDFAWDNEINRMQYWRMEKGANFTMKSLFKILEVHKMSLSDFFEDID